MPVRPEHPGETRLTVLVSGRVQGVGFRYWARGVASDLGLRGSATNLVDRQVEIVVEGPRGRCEQLLQALSGDGPPGHVSDVVHTWAAPFGEPSGFRVR